MLFTFVLLFLSFIATPSLFVKRFAKLQELYDRVKNYRTVIGVSYLLYGLFNLLNILMREDFDTLRVLASLCMILLGFLMGVQWIALNVFGDSQEAKDKIKEWYYKLSPYEGGLAIASLCFAILYLVF